MLQYCESLKLVPNDTSQPYTLKIPYTAMTMLHIYIKNAEKKNIQFDVNMVILACLRISATINDLEHAQDRYTKAYYDFVTREEQNHAKWAQSNNMLVNGITPGANIQSPTSNSSTIASANGVNQQPIPQFIIYEKII